MKKFFAEFKEFALRGNVVELAVGVLIGSAFTAVVNSFTDNIISPIIGLFTGANFDSLQVEIFGVTLKYGAFITAVISFLITAFIAFLLVRGMNKLATLGKKGKEEEEEKTTKQCPYCFTEIDIKATRCPNCTSELPQESHG